MKSLTRSEQAEQTRRLRRQDALMRTRTTPGGSVLVDCPYCLIFWSLQNPVDVTRFGDSDGKREHKASCSKGHTLHFRTIDEWREQRQRAGIQVKA